MQENKLEEIFNRAAKMPHDGCSLPEPERGASPIWSNIGLIRVAKRGKSPDEHDTQKEKERFQKLIEEQLQNGEINKREAVEILKLFQI